MSSILLTLTAVLGVATASMTKTTASCGFDLSDPRHSFRAILVRERHLTEPEARTADLRDVLIQTQPPGLMLIGRLLPRWQKEEAKGLLVTTSIGRTLVFRKDPSANTLAHVSPHARGEVSVWDGNRRLLNSVNGGWQWEVPPPKSREVSDLTLAQFLQEFETVLAPMLRDGEISEDEVLEGLWQIAGDAGTHVVFEAGARGAAGPRLFVFARTPEPRWDRDFVRELARGSAVSVGPGGRRLFQLYTPEGRPTGEPAWAPPRGVAYVLSDKVDEGAWRDFMTTHTRAVDDLMLHPLAPPLATLADATMVTGTVEDTGETIQVLLVPAFGAAVTTYDVVPYSTAEGWWLPAKLGEGRAVRLPDGRRFGPRPDLSGFRWLGRVDALDRLRAAAEKH